ncbi:MAG: argininosuccinate lyase, partial [Myxococcota bacterium]
MSTNKPWGGRFSEATDPTVERFSTSIHFDRILARHDLRGSRAQARMLGSTGLISNEDSEALLRGLDLIASEIEGGEFPFDAGLEDIHMNI